MTKNESKNKRPKGNEKGRPKKRIEIPAVSVMKNIVFSKKEAWAYYKIASVPYDFLTESGRASLSRDLMVAFSSLSLRAGQNVDLHILVTNTPYNVDSWEQQMFEIYDAWNVKTGRLDSFEKFMRQQVETLKSRQYKKKVVYLGVRMYTRGSLSIENMNMMSFGFKEIIEVAKNAISSILILPDEHVDKLESARANKDEYEIFRAITNSTLKGTRVSSEELLLVMKKTLHPAMPSPYLEVSHDERAGLNDIALETGAIIEDHKRYLKIRQMVGNKEYEGYRATLSFSKFPSSSMVEPNGIDPFMYFPTMMGLPYTMNARVTLMPVEKMKKDLQRKKLDNEDELKNLQESGQRASSSVMETQWDIDKLDQELNEDNMPWVTGNYGMTIEASTEDILKSAIQEIKQEYAKSETVLTWTTGDQMELLMEEMPGGKLEVNDFAQLTNLAMLGVSGFSYGGSVGDPVDEQLVLKRGGK